MSRTTSSALSQSAAFRSLDEAELDRLASACGERTYGPGEIVFLRGDAGDCMYVVASGSVAVSLSSADGRDVLLAVLGANHHFGELVLVDDGPRVATVTARKRSVLVVVPRRAVVDLMGRQPSVTQALLLSMAALVRRLDEQACDAALLDLPHRVEKHLSTFLPPRLGEVPPDGLVPVEVDLSQGDLARQIGGSRQQVNRVLMNLEADGSIARMGHRIVGIRPDRLYSDG
ncbi:MAG TPA: Crp/Fnr family transcriptional regulator [Actinomycetes bacterium]|nr:Crp/Fnr family transcriptional regulator [Actinomycetes bacterium]